MRSLDYRDLIFLQKEAQRKSIEHSLNTLGLMRTAFGSSSDNYKLVVSTMKAEMNRIQVGDKETIKNNWEDLRGRG